jgi:predicted O-linked N-acetylglucosamine transferase (SPINDLY family)
MAVDVQVFARRIADAMQRARNGRVPDALTSLRALAREDIGSAQRAELGSVFAACGAMDDAIACWRSALETRPDLLPVRCALVRALLASGDVRAALAYAQHPVLIDDTAALGDALATFASAGALEQQATLLEARAMRHPDDGRAALALAALLHGCGRLSEVIEWSQRAHALLPDATEPLEIEATARIDRGEVERGLASYRTMLARKPGEEMAARHLVLMHYDPKQSNATLFDALDAFAKTWLPASAREAASNPPDVPLPPLDIDALSIDATDSIECARPLRIGWLSPRFAEGPVGTFLTGLLAAFDRTRHRHVLIALQPFRDSATARLQSLAHTWLDLGGLDDAALLHRLRALELDVLVDLAGHSTANRLRVVAQRVAPLQVSWLDWFDTTAAPAMDAWISDRWLTPDGSTQRATERIVRLGAGRFCYTPSPEAPSPTHTHDGPVTFASFNRLAKINADVVTTWAEILRRVPGSRLKLAARLLDDAGTRAFTIERFAAAGIAPERLDLSGHRSYAELLAAYREVDIALDPFPFSGCTTTCDALYMGCAAIALPGETFVSRQSASLLWRIGRDEWIARDRDDYVARAVTVANAVEKLRSGREELREDVRTRLCDNAAQARDFAAALRMLRDLCRKKEPRIGGAR